MDIWKPTTVGFRPADGYHEYRFDWTPERVTFYADGKFLWESTRGVPFHAGGLTLSHWSNGDPGWSAGPPAKDAEMKFSYIKAYFNSSSDTSNKDYKQRCKDPSKPDAICKVPDQTSPPDPNKSTWFLSPNKGLPDNNPPPAKPPPPTSPKPSEPSPPPSEPSPPSPPSQKEVSPDNSCGGSRGYTCLGSENGDCCSSYGFWYVVNVVVKLLQANTRRSGSNSTYCEDPKCQPEFGTCGGTS